MIKYYKYIKMSEASKIAEILKDENKINNVSRAMFEEADTDKSGKINLKEMHNLIKKISRDFGLQEPSVSQAKEVLNELDEDENGEVDSVEFRKLVVDILNSMKRAYEQNK